MTSYGTLRRSFRPALELLIERCLPGNLLAPFPQPFDEFELLSSETAFFRIAELRVPGSDSKPPVSEAAHDNRNWTLPVAPPGELTSAIAMSAVTLPVGKSLATHERNDWVEALAFAQAANQVRKAVDASPGSPVTDLSGPTESPITRWEANGIETHADLWYCYGFNPEYYHTSISIWPTTTPPGPGVYEWTITSGTSIVDFHNGEDTFTSSTAIPVALVSTAPSVSMWDVSIEVKFNGNFLGASRVYVGAPKRFVHLYNEDLAGPGGGGWHSNIHYKIVDQFGVALPLGIRINEKFTTPDITDMAGENWPQSGEFGTRVWAEDWVDNMGAYIVAGQNPVPQNPQNPLGNTKVDHWTQEWRIFSDQPGQGHLMQRNTFQRYQDHGRHENVVSPVV